MEDNKGNINKTKEVDADQLSFLKIDMLTRGSHALSSVSYTHLTLPTIYSV